MTAAKRAGLALVVSALAVALTGCDRARAQSGDDTASIHLTCTPAVTGVRCQLLALSRDVRRSPIDITTLASWGLTGLVGARISGDGLIEALLVDGDVQITARFSGVRAMTCAHLTRDRPGRLLAIMHGHVYAEQNGTLIPVVQARVEVVAGPSAGRSTITREDGSYELVGITPGYVIVRASKSGYAAGDGSKELSPGDNWLSVRIDAVLCENSTEAESLDNRGLRGDRPRLIALEVGPPYSAQFRALPFGNLSGHASRHGLAAASARVRRPALCRLGQPAATGSH